MYNIDFMGNNTQTMIDNCNEKLSFSTTNVINNYINLLEIELGLGINIFTDYKILDEKDINVKYGYIQGIMFGLSFSKVTVEDFIGFGTFGDITKEWLYRAILKYREYENMTESEKEMYIELVKGVGK